jgi:hypothetical protein
MAATAEYYIHVGPRDVVAPEELVIQVLEIHVDSVDVYSLRRSPASQ